MDREADKKILSTLDGRDTQLAESMTGRYTTISPQPGWARKKKNI